MGQFSMEKSLPPGSVLRGNQHRWTVLAPVTGSRRGALAGTYGGATAEAPVGTTAGVDRLIGGFERSMVLSPVVVQAESGTNFAVGIGGLTLKPQ
ncbi:DUF992 domain-containing protein [Siculibacillus lacustris]|uniref:DUF992 domain-containing protein n=1 Tax=Siculibacillus lacustris TaxID=1549641 RepID=A0A4Q9VPK8_9HYPH|nr:DUF992 domain-containing protein [Siculibacillus lacustris]TBW37675.1 DUF992 domain-containing protein [Siculibacillus lacustris]